MSETKENIVLAMPARINGKLVPVTDEPVSVSAEVAEQLRAAGAVKEQEQKQRTLNDLKVDELKTIATAKGIEGADGMKKADLVEALEKLEADQ
ncbi:Rho termination factor N-terminal domain-containing protein [Idiomarina aminovorans]|uniref:Rho termination factor N-terminal domain-containing protein n=1 Tax=Idiomarina aminovorans TaxID=2914829 RepID=UPI002003F694|nr:Rho termination factor N-terminal domain-containing protein [Idiomarina sp. ATCH4]MCK7458495.1 Rho termination factor N-terminal domain-containing protein [Idiomarina sp. ATCH4]